MGKTLEAVRARRYDWTAAAGVLLAAAPSLIDWLLSEDGAPPVPLWLRWTLRAAGIVLAAQGRPLVVRGEP